MTNEFRAYFDTPVERENTDSVKWDLRAHFGNAGALPMWVADMDFKTVPEVIEEMTRRARHGVFGYTLGEDKFKYALVSWLRARHGLDVAAGEILFCPGVVDGIFHALSALLPRGNRVIVQSPVYGPFYEMVKKAGMELAENPLINTDGFWTQDFDGLEALLKQGAGALVLCSPHNPVGRVWTRDELETLTYLCEKYSVRIIADEIHSDFELDGRHTCILSLPHARNAVQLVSPTKTFNLAGLRHSAVICRDPESREKLARRLSMYADGGNLFGHLACRAAYETGAEWLDNLLDYLRQGRDILEKGLAETGVIKPSHTQGTYLMWADCREAGMDSAALKEFFIKRAGVIPVNGPDFGKQGEGFARFNFATTHANIHEAVRRIQAAVNDRSSK